MSVTQRFTGEALYLYWEANGTSAQMDADHRAFEVNASADMVEIQAGAETDKAYLGRLRDGDASIDLMNVGTAGTALYALIQDGQSGTLTFAPQGSATGKQYGKAVFIVKSSAWSYPYDGAATLKISLQKSGAWIAPPGGTAVFS